MIDRIGKKVHRVTTELRAGESKRMLAISDVHFDSTKCDREMLFRHLDEAVEMDAYIFINGDFFDVMQGKYDPRRTYSDLRPEYKSINYLDDVVNDAYEKLLPYQNHILIFGQGNHETNITNRLSTSLLDRLVGLLNHDSDHKIQVGQYEGWIIMQFLTTATQMRTIKINYHHGLGGNAPRSKGILQADIDRMNNPDADIILQGHTHQKWHLPCTVERLNRDYVLNDSTVHRIQTGSYKKKSEEGFGWATEKGFSKPRLGGWWIEFACVTQRHFEVRVIEAQ